MDTDLSSNNQQPYNMNADQTYNSIVFVKSFDEKDAAKRQSIARGVSLPDIWTIRSQEYVNSTTKSPGRRYTSRFEARYADAGGDIQIGELYVVAAVPGTFPSAGLTALLATFRAYVATAGTLEAVINDEK